MAVLNLIAIILWRICVAKKNYCLPPDTHCWPTTSEINNFSASVSKLVLPSDAEYDIYINMSSQDLLYRNQYPSFVVVCENVEDIQKSVLFASLHNIEISICSTGHSYSGRNTANNSLQIILSNMRRYKINQQESTITVETGLQWGSIYGLAAPNIVIGPDDPSVGPAGYSSRGGHSPISPHYGLSSDFTTEYFIVVANGDIVHVYNTSGNNQTIDDLFWSLKGGIGFGVIVNITFLMHKPEAESVFTRLMCAYPFYQQPVEKEGFILDTLFNNLWGAVHNELDQHWGGYVFTASDFLFFNVIYYGNSTYAQENAQPFLNLSYPYKNIIDCEKFEIYQTFEDYIITEPPYVNGKSNVNIFNNLIPKENLTEEYTDLLISYYNASHDDGFSRGLTGTFQGGKVNSFPDDFTGACPGFRHNQFEMQFGVVWTDENVSNAAISFNHEWESKFSPFGIGKYSNEENYECGNGCDWKQEFFGSNYNRLLKVKQIWDPNQVFWCNHCVGSDIQE